MFFIGISILFLLVSLILGEIIIYLLKSKIYPKDLKFKNNSFNQF